MYDEIEQAARSDIVRNWLGSLTLSKPVRNLGRDFSDGGLCSIFRFIVKININIFSAPCRNYCSFLAALHYTQQLCAR